MRRRPRCETNDYDDEGDEDDEDEDENENDETGTHMKIIKYEGRIQPCRKIVRVVPEKLKTGTGSQSNLIHFCLTFLQVAFARL